MKHVFLILMLIAAIGIHGSALAADDDGGGPTSKSAVNADDPNLAFKADGSLATDGKDPVLPKVSNPHCCTKQIAPGTYTEERLEPEGTGQPGGQKSDGSDSVD